MWWLWFWLPRMPFYLAATAKSPSFLPSSQWMQTKMKALGAGGYFVVCPSPKAPSKPRDQAEAADVPLPAEQSSPMMYSLNPAAPTMLLMRDGVQPLRWRSRDGFQCRGCVCKVHTSNIFLTFCGQTFVYMEIYIFLVDRAVRPVFIFLPSKASGRPKKAGQDGCSFVTTGLPSPPLSSPTQGDIIVCLLWAAAGVSVHHEGRKCYIWAKISLQWKNHKAFNDENRKQCKAFWWVCLVLKQNFHQILREQSSTSFPNF